MPASGFSESHITGVFNTIFRNIGSTGYKTALFGVNKNCIAISLHTAYPGFSPVANEVPTAGTNYARLYVPTDEDTWGISMSEDGTQLMAYCKIPLVFNRASSSWGQINYYSLHAARMLGTTRTNGIAIGNGSFPTNPVVNQGYVFKIPGSGSLGVGGAGLVWAMDT